MKGFAQGLAFETEAQSNSEMAYWTKKHTHLNTRGVYPWEVKNLVFVHVWLRAMAKCPEMRSVHSQVCLLAEVSLYHLSLFS